MAYVEGDHGSPVNVYGMSKFRAEEKALAHYREALIIRSSAFFGPWDEFNFAHAVLRSLSTGNHFIAADDEAAT